MKSSNISGLVLLCMSLAACGGEPLGEDARDDAEDVSGASAGSVGEAAQELVSSCYGGALWLEKICQVDAKDEAGVKIGVVPGQYYTLEVFDGSWQAHGWGGPLYQHGWVTNSSDPNWYRMTSAIDSNDVDQHWAESVESTSGGYYRMWFMATTSSIRFRVADAPGSFYDNSGFLKVWLMPQQ